MPLDIAHTGACKERQAAAQAYETKWPKFCRPCGGAGSWYSPGNYHNPPDGGACDKCVEKGVCPRCAGPLDFVETKHEDWSKCPACGWDEKAAIDDPAKFDACPDASCYCWEESESA